MKKYLYFVGVLVIYLMGALHGYDLGLETEAYVQQRYVPAVKECVPTITTEQAWRVG